jgi:hypothetical protein
MESEMTMSFAGAQSVAAQYPQYSDQIMAGAKTAFLAGDDMAYLAGIIAVFVGAVLVFLVFPKMEQERKLLAEYHAQDAGEAEAIPSKGERDFATP